MRIYIYLYLYTKCMAFEKSLFQKEFLDNKAMALFYTFRIFFLLVKYRYEKSRLVPMQELEGRQVHEVTSMNFECDVQKKKNR